VGDNEVEVTQMKEDDGLRLVDLLRRRPSAKFSKDTARRGAGRGRPKVTEVYL